ncbi:MAG: ABC transporter ATP-binding protein [Burkholderiales bacterium]|nr:ABC transporter ATP-binding protein [Burkholderiales bacterium]
MNRLETHGLTVTYGNAVAVENMDVSVKTGTVACILGANGAGKSSFLKCLVGLVPARSGKVVLDGRDITNINACEAAARGIALSPEGRRLFPDLTVFENLCIGGYLRRRDASFRSDIDKVFGYFPRLQPRVQQLAGSLSGGEQQMVAIGRALMSRPSLLLLDEPSLGLAPLIVSQLASIITTINREGLTIVLVEQNARLALRLSHDAYVFETGRLALKGPSSELLQNPYVAELYLGDKSRSEPIKHDSESAGSSLNAGSRAPV